MKYPINFIALVVVMALGSGCTSHWSEVYHSESERAVSASLLDYLQQNQTRQSHQSYQKFSTPTFWKNPPSSKHGLQDHTKGPDSIGIAFVPGNYFLPGMSEARKVDLMRRIKQLFEFRLPGVPIHVIPETLLRERGGFQNLREVGKTYQLENVALISFDQTLYTEDNELATLNWTVLGAMFLPGSQFETQTMVDISMFRISNQKLVLHATGTDDSEDVSTLFSSVRELRRLRYESFIRAFDQVVENLSLELNRYNTRQPLF